MSSPDWLTDPSPRPVCKVLPDPLSDHFCGRPCGDRTVLDTPVCDECYEFIRSL